MQIAILAGVGRITGDVLLLVAAALPAVVAGLFAGAWLRRRVEAERFRAVVVAVLDRDKRRRSYLGDLLSSEVCPMFVVSRTIVKRMLTKRIIPCFDVADGRVVKGIRFLNLRDAGDPVELARAYDEEGADELVFLDIRASPDRRETAIEMVRSIANEVFIPFTVGGGIRSPDDVRQMLESGADKVSINTAAMENGGPRAGGGAALRLAVHRRRHRRQASRATGSGRSTPTAVSAAARPWSSMPSSGRCAVRKWAPASC